MTSKLSYIFCLISISISSTTQLDLQAKKFISFLDRTNLNTFANESIILNDPDRFTLEKRQIAKNEFLLKLTYTMPKSTFLTKILKNYKRIWLYTNTVTPYTYFSMVIDVNSQISLKIKKLLKKIPSGFTTNLENILKFLNVIEWTPDLLANFNSLMKFQSVYKEEENFNHNDRGVVNAIIKNFGIKNIESDSRFTLKKTVRYEPFVINNVIFVIKDIFYKMPYDLNQILNPNFDFRYQQMTSEDIEKKLSKLRISNPQQAKICEFILEFKELMNKNNEYLFEPLRDQEKFDKNFNLPESLHENYKEQILPLLKGNIAFFIQILIKQFQENNFVEQTDQMIKKMNQLELSIKNKESIDKIYIFNTFITNNSLMYIMKRMKKWDRPGAKDLPYCIRIKDFIQEKMDWLYAKMTELDLTKDQQDRFQRFYETQFEYLKTLFMNTRPGLLFFYKSLQSDFFRIMYEQGFQNFASTIKLHEKNAETSITDNMSYLVHLLGYQTSSYPNPVLKFYMFELAEQAQNMII